MKNSFSVGSASRREFLSAGGLLTAALASGLGRGSIAADAPATGAKRIPIGLELYSVRGEMDKNLMSTIKAVGKMGYEVVEFYSPYFKWPPTLAKMIRATLDDSGLKCLSTHNGFESFASPENLAKAIELNQILGCKYMVLASAPKADGVDGWKGLCDKLTKAQEQLRPHGLFAGYHNHQSEWAKLENGQRIMEVIAANTPKDFALQLDVGTCEEAGVNPVEWVKANPGRIKMMHMKDWAPADAGKADKGYRVLFNEGITPWKELISAAETVGGAEFLLIEQEGSRFSELETAQKCLENWKTLRQS